MTFEVTPRFEVYCDGSAVGGNPGYAGWAYLILAPDGREWRGSGWFWGTNNQAELLAVIEATRQLLSLGQGAARICTDSVYSINALSGRSSRVANLDLIRVFDEVARGMEIEWVWVRGHSGNPGNEEVDEAARAAARLYQKMSGENHIAIES